MTSQGSPHARFRRALDTENLLLARACAAELPHVPLPDAPRLCALMAREHDPATERALVRWLGRLCLETQSLTLAEASAACSALIALRAQRPDDLLEGLSAASR